MRKLTRKFIAVLMLLWLPLSMGSALASAMTMQTQHGDCHGMTMPGMQHNVAMQHHDQAGHHHVQPADDHGTACNACGTCHLACSACMAAAPAIPVTHKLHGQEYAPPLVSYESVPTVPLLPPPLARA